MSSITSTAARAALFDPDVFKNGDPATFGLPLEAYAYLREHDPCFLQEFDSPFLRERAWVFTRYEDVSAINRDGETWSAVGGPFLFRFPFLDIQHPLGKPSLLTTDAPDAGRQRGTVNRGFTPARVAELEKGFRDYARQIVDEALEVGTCNFVRKVAHTMPTEALGDVLGIPSEDREQFFHWVDTLASPFDERVTPSLEAALAANIALMEYAKELAGKRLESGENDVISELARANAAGRISDAELAGNVGVLANGAAESTRSALSHGVHQLMLHPDKMAWLRERASDIPLSAIHEMVRFSTPFPQFIRHATRDVEIRGQRIQEGDCVLFHLASANFDPEAFDRPDEIDLERDSNAHLSFGRGPHACLGKHVAALEMKILLEELLRRTKDIVPAGPVLYGRCFVTRPIYDLPVTLVPA